MWGNFIPFFYKAYRLFWKLFYINLYLKFRITFWVSVLISWKANQKFQFRGFFCVSNWAWYFKLLFVGFVLFYEFQACFCTSVSLKKKKKNDRLLLKITSKVLKKFLHTSEYLFKLKLSEMHLQISWICNPIFHMF